MLNHTGEFLSKLNGVRETANGWEARCPCRNDDDNPSLAISEDDSNGNIIVFCHRGNPCSTKEICASIGESVAVLFPPSKREPQNKDKLTLVKTYDFTDEHGTLLFQKLRYVDGAGKKTFRQRKPDGRGGWEYALGDTPKVLYNLPAVLDAVKNGSPVWLVEGEKDADTLNDLGMTATTMPGGAGKWLDIHTDALRGAVVDICADNDEPGYDHAKKVYAELHKAGCDVAVWHTPKGKDVTDFLAVGGKLGELIELAIDAPATTAPSSPVIEIVSEVSPWDTAVTKLNDLLTRGDLTPQQLLVKASQIASSVKQEQPVDFGRLVNWEEFQKEVDRDNYDWVIEGLLERSERVIVVAAEGVGKTMLARQVAILSACGIHPFTYQRMKQVRTLTVDLENPESIIRRASRNIWGQSLRRGFVQHGEAYLLIKPEGLDLMRNSDREVLEKAIEEIKPEILFLGPLYKAFLDPGNRTSEAVVIEVAKYLDYVRTHYKCALWLEHHAPLGSTMATRDLRPFGSSVWSRWPEFGISLTPDPTAMGAFVYDVKHFRGARDERQWPTKMKRGSTFPFEVLEFMKVST